ncbi:putative transcription factor bHLH041 isoform X2 [Rhododendron vialii]|uniref:putative transcription factor bHLH041 isoform X2 n=1 Tax=Rhododendron vialii TaxID=182163 RepID=UPI0026601E6E|nr:putative transcription factor bHLH041 isoform X2 [Rhododendron vialii]
MDSIFQLDDGGRATFLQHMLHSFASTYICLWSYIPQPSSCLISTDGLYIGENNQPSSSSGTGSRARRLFDEYRQGLFVLGNDQYGTNYWKINNVSPQIYKRIMELGCCFGYYFSRVPGLAFRNGVPYMELKELDLLSLASIEPQLQFYQTAIFMGCNIGEIELGFSNDTQVNLEMEMRSWFPDDFSRQLAVPPIELPPTDQPRPSSSSSSLRSLSMGSPEASPFLFNIPSTPSSLLGPPIEPSNIGQVVRPLSSSTSPLPQAFIQFPSIQFPTPETTATTTTEAGTSQKPSAFKRFRSALGPSTMTITAGVRKPNIQKRAITFFRSLSLMRIQGRAQGSRPMSSTQLHHMISERKRREKLNESFQALRSLLPPGTKKDKASVLASTTDYLASLKAQVEELNKRNRDLEERVQLLAKKKDHDQEVSLSPDQRLDVRITHEAESTSQARIIGLQVVLSGECNVMDLVTRILEFLRRVENASLLSVEADAQVVDSNPINIVRLRLRIEGGEWDESAFQEAVRRVVADMSQ